MGISILGRGFQLFVKIKTSGKLFDWFFETYGIEQYVHLSRLLKNRKMRTFCHRKPTVTNQNSQKTKNMRTFSQKNSCDQSKYFQNIEACLSKERILFHRIFCILGNWLSFQNPQNPSRKKAKFASREDFHKVIRWIFLLKLLCGWALPSSREVHTDQGKTLLRRLCVQVGAASQISWMLTEDICS